MRRDEWSLSPYVERSRSDWAELAASTPAAGRGHSRRLRGLDDPTSLLDVREVYLPLTRLLSSYVLHTGELHRSTNDDLQALGQPDAIRDRHRGVGGGRQVDHRAPALDCWLRGRSIRVSLVTTDGFLLPNAGSRSEGLMTRKGFPESYDRRALCAS